MLPEILPAKVPTNTPDVVILPAALIPPTTLTVLPDIVDNTLPFVVNTILPSGVTTTDALPEPLAKYDTVVA